MENQKLRAYKIVDENGIAHYYPSVTAILSYVMPPDLKKWAARNSALRVAREYRAAIKEKRKITQKELVALGLDEPEKMMKASQVRGVAVHKYAEDYFNNAPLDEVPKELQGYVDSFLKWCQFYPCKVILQEEVLYSHKYKFAGRMDFYGELNGRKVLIDFKTANFAHPDWGLQLAAYKECLESMGYPVDDTYILHLKSHGFYEFIKFNDAFDLFLDVRKLFAWKVKAENPEFELALTPDDYINQNKDRQ